MNETTPLKKVFVVEDDVFLSSIITSKIKEHNLDVTPFTTGTDVLEAIKTTVPDIFILDIYLPGINGLEILKTLRDTESTKHTPVIVVSNTDEKKDRDTATSFGAKFIIKAVTDPEDIVKEITETLTAIK